MKKNNITKMIFIGILGLLLAAGCAKNGSNGATGPAGVQGTQGATGLTLPSVTWVMPIPEATDVYTDSVIKAGFSNPMNASTINTSTFLVSTGGVPITGTVSYNAGAQTAFFSPNLPLNAFGSYTITLTTGIKDTSANPITAAFTWTFMANGSSTPSRLYVASANTPHTLLVFNNASSANGNLVPDRTITSGAFSWPWRIWLDKASDRLYVTDDSTGHVLVFSNAGTINGAAPAPVQDLSGTLFTEPGGMWLDTVNDRLYMADANANAIYIFNNVSTLNGTVIPDRIVWGSNTTLNYPEFIWLDERTDSLYIANFSAQSILVFNSASTINGNIAPGRTITGPTITGPAGIWLDTSSDRLYVADSGGSSLLIFNNASTLNGAVTPDRILSGTNTTFTCPYGLWLDVANDRLYVADFCSSSVDVFNSASTINGNIAPSRIIAGANTGLNYPESLWLDMNP
jgi:hypothetical protein